MILSLRSVPGSPPEIRGFLCYFLVMRFSSGRGGWGMGAGEKEEREEGGESEAVCERCDNIVSSLTTFIQKWP